MVLTTGIGREMTPLEKDLHQLRKEIDVNIRMAGEYKLERGQDGTKEEVALQREIALAYTKLQEAKMWVGKCLEAIGSELPKEFQDKAE